MKLLPELTVGNIDIGSSGVVQKPLMQTNGVFAFRSGCTNSMNSNKESADG